MCYLGVFTGPVFFEYYLNLNLASYNMIIDGLVTPSIGYHYETEKLPMYCSFAETLLMTSTSTSGDRDKCSSDIRPTAGHGRLKLLRTGYDN